MSEEKKDGKNGNVKKFVWTGNNVFGGVILLLAATALLVNRLGYLEGIGIWPTLFTIVLVATLLDGLVKGSFSEILFSIAFLIIVNDELLHLEAITPWPVLWAAALGSIGLKMIFPRFRRRRRRITHVSRDGGKNAVNEELRDGDRISYETNFGEAVRYISGGISQVDVECNFGSLQIYFSDAQLTGGSARVHVDTAFGSTVLYVPASWKVVLDVENSFAGTTEKGHCNPDGENVLYIFGEVAFGGLQIRYV